MKLLSRSASVFVGLAVLAAFASSPAKAESTFSGASTFSTPSGYTQSVSGELTTTTGTIQGGTSTTPAAPSVNAVFQDVTTATPGTSGTLTLNAYIDNSAVGSIEQVVANELDALDITTTGVLEKYTSILQAAGGTDGLE